MQATTSLKEISLSGSPFEKGFLHGKAFSVVINQFLNDDVAQVNRLRKHPLNIKTLEKFTYPYYEIIEEYLPDIAEEIRGLAKGASIKLWEATLLQVRRELIGTDGLTLAGDCSSYALHTGNDSVIGQTIDLNGNMTPLGQVFRIKPSAAYEPEIIMYSFAGLLGYLGMNSHGLAIGINLVVSGGWCVGVPPYLMVRRLLLCRTIEECIDIISSIPRSSSRSFTITDRCRSVIVEMTTSDYRIIEGHTLFHTNHYIHKDFVNLDTLNIFSLNSSFKRLQLLEKRAVNRELKEIKKMFIDHSLYPVGLCAHNDGNEQLNETAAAVVMYPLAGEFFALKGKPCQNEFQKFELNAL